MRVQVFERAKAPQRDYAYAYYLDDEDVDDAPPPASPCCWGRGEPSTVLPRVDNGLYIVYTMASETPYNWFILM